MSKIIFKVYSPSLLAFDIDIDKSLSCARVFETLWTVAYQALLSMGFSRQEYWSGLPFPSPRDLPDPRIEPASLVSHALAGRFCTTSATWEERRTSQKLLKQTEVK